MPGPDNRSAGTYLLEACGDMQSEGMALDQGREISVSD
jgi:hypothetical protein